MMMHPHEQEEMEMRFSPKLWDADPDVCCAAFQLGACEHTEAFDEERDLELAEALAAEMETLDPADWVPEEEAQVAGDWEEPF